ncbi:MAG: primase [Paenibacillus sp.]|jgi:DNA primase catalytic core|nr:primase [Paenibacillus sp.]
MAVHFSEKYVDTVLSNIDMMELMKNHGYQTKAGVGDNNYFVADFCCGKTDFDNGRIKKKTQTWKCLSCGMGGNAIHFLTKVVGKTFYDAMVELSDMSGMNLPVDDPKVISAQKRKGLALKLAVEFYYSQNNYEYLLSRGISLDVLKKARAGYAPGGRALRNHLEQQGFTKEELSEYKLINHKGLDTFFYRAVIPVYRNGKVIDLYGRAVDDAKTGVKHLYLYGDDILGGFDQIKDGIVLIFESAIDRLVAESEEVTNGVDTGGAKKFTADHARLLRKKGVEKTFTIYDGDNAGREGSLAVGDLLLREGIKNWVAELPEGKDPANMIQKEGKEAFLSAVHGSKKFETFKMYHELEKYSLDDIEMFLADKKKKLTANASAAGNNETSVAGKRMKEGA